MEWLEDYGMIVDIGYMPKMALTVTSPSVLASEVDVENQLPAGQFDLSSIAWKEKISKEEAHRLLEVKMYPFKEVWYNVNYLLYLSGVHLALESQGSVSVVLR